LQPKFYEILQNVSLPFHRRTCRRFLYSGAQATRTWVSGVGDDVNPCSRTAPCKTFAGAISKTAPGGEIDALDPGRFGTLTITKAMTINGTFASGLNAGTDGFNVIAGAGDTITLRGISIQGINTGSNAINFISGAHLNVIDCIILNQGTDGFITPLGRPVSFLCQTA
jgi:hypothetical protein